MGSGQSKLSYLSNKRKRVEKGQPCFKRLQDLKEEETQQFHDGCISPHFGKSGLAFYAPLNENGLSGDNKRRGFEDKPKLSSEKHMKAALSDSLRSKEREILVEEIVEQNLQEKCRKARLAEEKRLLVISRKEKKEEIREKNEAKMKKMEERMEEVQNRLRPPNSKVRSFHNENSKVNFQKLEMFDL
ncbi:uncharacterized protein LOC123534480 [Mercenaria mercenaria]|uniref:uncharacterized protein LOC123534480 n=1 Tax=Mercenaria mercenaria TaxID=6596 RepID=UPI00234E3A61|nr:uncharacterized protein LOC123534480 [Mercenaria mercenaria]